MQESDIPPTDRSGLVPPIAEYRSVDGTRKYLFPITDRLTVETVYIPDGKRHTLCVSTQVGCRMHCRFCRTGQMGLLAQVSSDQILNQVYRVPVHDQLTHLVFMGMGEPLDAPAPLFEALDTLLDPRRGGFAPRRVSVSTAGVLPGLALFLQRYSLPLSLSVHTPFPEQRARIMPIEKTWPLAQVLAVIRAHPRSRKRRLFCEYLVIRNWNHSERHAEALATLLQDLPARINLMRPHPVPGQTFPAAEDASMLAFRDALNQRGLIATIRRSRGQDIQAACGMLATPAAGPVAS